MELHSLKYENELAVKAIMARVETYLADQRAQLELLEKLVALANCTIKSKEVQFGCNLIG